QVEISPLTISFLKGFLEPMVEEAGSINFVNAPILARERGIAVTEVKAAESGNYTAMISVDVESDTVRKVAGTLFGHDDPRIVLIDGYRVDVVPQGNILVVPHQDKPKVAGPVATILGEHDINIAGMQVGRQVLGGKAIIILAVDTPVPDDVMTEITGVDGVDDVRMAAL
ncbi:MAG: phosphoglycerate dehydrogenase, partial [Firmicutes bacterium HGW-Firmicutes-14]